MASKWIFVIGSQLLLLSHVAQSFILLTANMEDVKKIARKFVSDSLAEKIAEFVAKATEQIVANVSEENDQNVDDIQNLSDENDKLQSIGRQRPETTKDDQTIKYVEFEYEKASTVANEKTTEKGSNAGQVINWEKEVNEIAVDKYSKEVDETPKLYYDQPKTDKQKLDYEKPKPDNEQPKLEYERQTLDYGKLNDYEQPNHENDRQKLDNELPRHENNRQKLDNELPRHENDPQKLDDELPRYDNNRQKLDFEQSKRYEYEQLKLEYKKPKVRKLKKRHQNKQILNKQIPEEVDLNLNKYTHKPRLITPSRPTIDSTILYQKALRNGPASNSPPKRLLRGHRLTGFDSQEAPLSTNQTLSTLRGFNIPMSLTTAKERVEFDQYDNPNYPKADFIATSGPVALPKVPMMKPWWEKEMVAV